MSFHYITTLAGVWTSSVILRLSFLRGFVVSTKETGLFKNYQAPNPIILLARHKLFILEGGEDRCFYSETMVQTWCPGMSSWTGCVTEFAT